MKFEYFYGYRCVLQTLLRLAMLLLLSVGGLSSTAWAVGDEPVDLLPYFGLTPGNFSSYRGKSSSDTSYSFEHAEVGELTDFHGIQAYPISWIEDGVQSPYATQFLAFDADFVCYYGERGDEPLADWVFSPPICIPRYLPLGATFETRTQVTDPNGRQTSHTFVWTNIAQEAVTVPAGTFPDSLRVQAGWADDQPFCDNWYAKDVGFIKGAPNPSCISQNDWFSDLISFSPGPDTTLICSAEAGTWIYKAYRGYYGRCPDSEGYAYWCDRLEREGGGQDLSPIIAAFGTSQEYTDRFSALSDEELIDNLYLNMFDRHAEPGGLAFYLGLLDTWRQEWRDTHGGSDDGATEYALSRIALDVLNGAQGSDVTTLDEKIAGCESY